jgi:hypothetical protein
MASGEIPNYEPSDEGWGIVIGLARSAMPDQAVCSRCAPSAGGLNLAAASAGHEPHGVPPTTLVRA